MSARDTTSKFDHVVSIMFEGRSFDNLLGRLYQPGEVASFEGVIGKDLSNPIPELAADGVDQLSVWYGVAANMDTPDPAPGNEYQHVNTQLFGRIDPRSNWCRAARDMVSPYNRSAGARWPAMNGFVVDYISAFTAATGRQPSCEEYSQIMTGYTPEQVPVLSAIAKGFATFDHWYCEVPSQSFTNRSFHHAGTASGFVVDFPYENFPVYNDAETIFERLDAAGLSWRVYVDTAMRASVTGIIHAARLSEHFATNFSSLDDFFDDAEKGTLPTYSFIEPALLRAHNDYRPALKAAFPNITADSPSSILAGEDLLGRVYSAVRAASNARGSHYANTLLVVSFADHGGTYDHVAPPLTDPPDPGVPVGQMGFGFDRLGVRVPAVAISAYVDPMTVVTDEYRSTSVIRTLRERWPIGIELTARDETAADIAPVLSRRTPRPQEDWPEVAPRPVPQVNGAPVASDNPLGPLGVYLLGVAMELDTHSTGYVCDLDPATATLQQAEDYMNDRMPKVMPGLTSVR